MRHRANLIALCIWVLTAVMANLPPVAAQQWPSRTVTIIVPSAPGDGSDIVARLFGEKLAQRLGQPFVVENKVGAGGAIGTALAATSAPDGYTFIMGNAGSHGINSAVYAKLAYDVERDFAPISMIFRAPNIFVASPSTGITSIAALVEKMKAEPGKLNYASGGQGSSAHMNAEYLKLVAGGLKAQHVPYRGATLALNDIIGGQVEFMSVNLPPAIGLVREGKVTPLAVTSARRSPVLPDVPTMAEAGFASYETIAWFGLLAPTKTPPAILEAMEREIAAICQLPDIRTRLEGLGGEAACLPAMAMKAFISTDIARWRSVAAAAGVKLE